MSKTIEEIKEDFLNELNKTNELILSAYKNAVNRLHNDKQELIEQNRELVSVIKKLNKVNPDFGLYDEAKELLTKCQKS